MSKNLITLEYPKIIEELSVFAITYLGKQFCLELVPSSDAMFVKQELSKTTEAVSLLTRTR